MKVVVNAVLVVVCSVIITPFLLCVMVGNWKKIFE
jgi:hypothetical protein